MAEYAPFGATSHRLASLTALVLLFGSCGAPNVFEPAGRTVTPTTPVSTLDGPVKGAAQARLDPVLFDRLRAAALADRTEVADRFAFSRLVVVAGETFEDVDLHGVDPAERRVVFDVSCGEPCALTVAELLRAALSAAERGVQVNLPPPLEGFVSWPTLTFGDQVTGARWRVSFYPDQLGLAAVEYFGPLPPRP